ncbi:MAG: hypothetical protein ABJD13_18210 [Paracoccaceae bacterium]
MRRTLVTRLIGFIGVVAAIVSMSPNQAGARELAVLSDKSAKVTTLDTRCYSTATFRIDANSATFFESRLQDLGGLFSVALNKTYARCSNIRTVRIDGFVGSVKLISGTASGQDQWRLVLGVPALNKVAADIPKTVNTLEKIPNLLELFAPFQTVPGIAQTQGYGQFAGNAQTVVTNLVFGRDSEFDAFVLKHLKSGTREKAKTRVDDILAVVALYNQIGADGLTVRFGQIADRLATVELASMLETVLVSEAPIDTAVTDVGLQIARQAPAPTLVQDTDRLVSEWVETRLADHTARHSGQYLNDLRAHLELIKSLKGVKNTGPLPQTHRVIGSARAQFDELVSDALADHLQDAKALISSAGTSYLDADTVIETGLTLQSEFVQFGFEQEGQALVEHALTHSEALIADGLPNYRTELTSMPMKRDTVTALRKDAALFEELSTDFPQFQAYADATFGAIDIGKQRECRLQAASIRNDRNDKGSVVVAQARLSLDQLACALYRNDHVMTGLTIASDGRSGVLEVDAMDNGPAQYDLVSVSTPYQLVLSDAERDAELSELILPPPSGKPDAKGVTECDLLAGDPADTAQPTRGVDFNHVPADFDFDRAVEACIAAVDFAPDATRQVFQLARVLDFLGESETAQHYIEVASASQYGPALHLNATSVLSLRDDDDAFFDAIDLFKLAAARGYGPSKRELAELIPPGSDLFRESPPPSDTEMIKAFGQKQCEGVRGFAQGCVYRNGVHRKSCFQTSETEFSCEVVFRQKCEFNTFDDPLMRLLSGMVTASCPNRSDPVFLKFTKRANGWSARKEF